MKKIFIPIIAFIFLLSGTIMTSSFFSFASEGEEEIARIYEGEDFINAINSDNFESENLTIVLENDIDFGEVDLKSAYETEKIFRGTFDGNGQTISNLTLGSGTNNYGLFPKAEGAEIKDLKISGKIAFNFNDDTMQKYAGILVGQATNVYIHNCEFIYDSLTKEDTLTPISLNVGSNLVFGVVAGRVNSKSGGQSEISDCVSYYDVDVSYLQNTLSYLGGIVGQLQAGSKIKNVLNWGNYTLQDNIIGQTGDNEQFIGGIVGNLASSTILNCGYAGVITNNSSLLLKCQMGAIVGKFDNGRVAYSYWTQGAIMATGAGTVEQNQYLQQVAQINENFLRNTDNFDIVELCFNFDTIWCLKNSRIVLQRFQTFNYSINEMFDNTGVLSNAVIKTSEDNEGASSQQVQYGKSLTITISYNTQYYGYYTLDSVLLQGEALSRDYYQAQEIVSEDNLLIGYDIQLDVNDVTDGTYSFTLSPSIYQCQVKISDEAALNNQGGVSAGSNYIDSLSINFTYQTRIQEISARGEGIYTFSHWELYYKAAGDGSGEYTSLVDNFEDANSSLLSISFGIAPFDQEFLLVAYFTSENAILIDINDYQNVGIKSVTINEKLYEGEPIAVSNSDTNVRVKLVTNAKYLLDEEIFLSSIAKLYGQDLEELGIVMTSDPIEDEQTQETTYNFRLNMNLVQELEDKSISLSFVTEKDNSQYNQQMLFVYIFVPIGVALIVGVTVFLIVRRVRSGKGKTGAKKQKEKETSYKDFYM